MKELTEEQLKWISDNLIIKEKAEIAATKEETKIEYPYVTIDGEEPPIPSSFFHTKKFLALGFCAAMFMGILAYLFIYVK